uniref:Rhodanese domain-containing protein n=1 Tax=Otus sunia TaxID=257818 RepID=A0A8C8ADT4_9STRI
EQDSTFKAANKPIALSWLFFSDARTQREYNESHIITARRIEQSPTGEYLVPDSEELGCVRYCVVYDCRTSSLDCCDYEEEEKGKDAEEGTAVQYARSLQQFTRHPVLVLKGGYKRFSACYPFLRTQKILWMPQVCRRQQIPPCICSRFTRSKSFFFLCHHLSFHRCSAGLRSSAGVLQPGDKPEQHSNHGLSYALLPVFSEESLGLCSEMQNERETTPGLCETALRLGDPNLRDHDHRHL